MFSRLQNPDLFQEMMSSQLPPGAPSAKTLGGEKIDESKSIHRVKHSSALHKVLDFLLHVAVCPF